ncbi:hypothetical protein BH09ACT6_BH09ACT6_23590 [soil metagenome]
MSDAQSSDTIAYEVPIERGAIRTFRTAMQSSNSAYEGVDAIIPPTFLITAWRWAPEGGRAAHGIPRSLLLHGEQEFIYHQAPPRSGQVLIAKEHIRDRFEKAGKRGGVMQFVVISTEFTDENGTLVAEMRSTFIGREPKGEAV